MLVACAGDSGGAVESSGFASPPAGHSIATGTLSAEKSSRVDLGVHRLEERLWVSWELTGPERASAKLRLYIESQNGRFTQADVLGPINSGNIDGGGGPAMHIEHPGRYRVVFGQTVQPGAPSGYVVRYDVRAAP
jgi:hypothetical protein